MPNNLGPLALPGEQLIDWAGAQRWLKSDADNIQALAHELGALKLAYLHLVDHSSMGAPEVPAAFKAKLRAAFGGSFIASGGLDRNSAEQVLKEGRGDLVAFGRAWLANPDLIERMQAGLALNANG